MTEKRLDFARDARKLLKNGVISTSQLADALQQQYRAGFLNGQRDGEDYQSRQYASEKYRFVPSDH